MIVAPKTECTLPILCISTTHGAMSGTRTPNSRKVTGICAGLPRDLNSRLAANTLARLKAVFCLPAPTEIAAKHQAKEHRSKAYLVAKGLPALRPIRTVRDSFPSYSSSPLKAAQATHLFTSNNASIQAASFS